MGIKSISQRMILVAGIAALGIASTGCDRSPQAKSAKFMAEGKKLMAKNDPARAILQFRNAAQTNPKDAEAFYQLGMASLAVGDFRQAVGALRKTLDLNPKHQLAQLRLAELMTNVDDPTILKDAEKRLEALLLDSPENPDALHALALTELKLGETDDAEENMERAVSSAPHELVYAVTLSQAKMAQKDLKGAEAVLKKACDDFPKSPDAPVILGRFYSSQNRLPEAEQQFQRALAMDPKSGAALLNLATLQIQTGRIADAEKNVKQLSGLQQEMFKPVYGNFLSEQGRHEEAVHEFERLAKQDPDDRMARTRLVAAYQAAGRTADAQKVLNEALKKNQNDLDALLQRGELLLQTAKYTEAEADFSKVLHLKPDAPEIHYAMAKLDEARGEPLRQREELTAALRLNPRLMQIRLALADSFVSNKAYPAAIDTLNQAPDDQKGLVALIEERNWALIGLGQTAEARRGLDLALAKVRAPMLLLQDAILKLQAKRYPEARQSLHEMLAKSPEDLRGLRVLVATYVGEHQIQAAVTEVKAYAAAHPKAADVQYFLGDLLLQTGDKIQAKQAFANAKAINPNYAPADMSLAQVNLLQSNWTDARQALNTIIASKGENPTARQWLGMLEAASGDQTAAIADFRKVIEFQPNNALAFNNLAYLLAESGNQTEEPLKYAEKAVELDPTKAEFEDTLGWVLYRRAVYDLAVKHLESAVSKKSSALPNYHLAMAYKKAGKEERAKAALNTALRQDASLPEAKIAQDLFRTSGEAAGGRP